MRRRYRSPRCDGGGVVPPVEPEVRRRWRLATSRIAAARWPALAVVVGALALAAAQGRTEGRAPYLDPGKPIDARVEDLIARLTLEEKVGLVHANGKFRAGGVERLGVPYLWTADGPQGVREE